MSGLSVITLTRHRDLHLHSLIEGLCTSEVIPNELIVIDMGDRPATLPDTPFPLSALMLPGAALPLAAARNLGARQASGEYLLFLDVDCIPRRNLIATMISALEQHDALICAEPRYLGPLDRHLDDDEQMLTAALPHPARSFPAAGLQSESNPGLFWSLAFGIRRRSFVELGGFDEQFVGYGAEDTDFGFRAAEASLPLLFLGGTGAFHQHHQVYSPPLQHLADIVRNANLFHAKWKTWPMDGWLRSFESMGLVQFEGSRVVQLRDATPHEINAAKKDGDARF